MTLEQTIKLNSLAEIQSKRISQSTPKTDNKAELNSRSFQNVFEEQIQKAKNLTFSKHATQRLDMRDISLSDEQLKRIEMGISDAKAKGITDSLVLVDDVALVVNIQKKHVITAIEKSQAQNNIFTNINGAVIV